MGTTFAGDIPSGAFGVGVISHAALASDGGAATYGGAGAAEKWRAPQNIRIVDAWWEPSGADNAATSLTSYRLMKLVQGSTDATGTVVLEISVGGNHSVGTVTQEGQVRFTYRPI